MSVVVNDLTRPANFRFYYSQGNTKEEGRVVMVVYIDGEPVILCHDLYIDVPTKLLANQESPRAAMVGVCKQYSIENTDGKRIVRILK